MRSIPPIPSFYKTHVLPNTFPPSHLSIPTMHHRHLPPLSSSSFLLGLRSKPHLPRPPPNKPPPLTQPPIPRRILPLLQRKQLEKPNLATVGIAASNSLSISPFSSADTAGSAYRLRLYDSVAMVPVWTDLPSASFISGKALPVAVILLFMEARSDMVGVCLFVFCDASFSCLMFGR